jgi:shikimate kinase
MKAKKPPLKKATMLLPDKIFLIGFSGSGKSTIGKLLAERLEYRFIDTDTEIVKQAKMTIPELFAAKGEPYFRRLESSVISKVCQRPVKAVVSLGGGSFLKAVNRTRVYRSGLSIYLKCSQQELLKRTRGDRNRPLLKPSETHSTKGAKLHLKRLLLKRFPGYTTAQITFTTTDNTPKAATNELVKLLKVHYGAD